MDKAKIQGKNWRKENWNAQKGNASYYKPQYFL